MICTDCLSPTRVLHIHTIHDGHAVSRRRQCKTCFNRHTTIEFVVRSTPADQVRRGTMPELWSAEVLAAVERLYLRPMHKSPTRF